MEGTIFRLGDVVRIDAGISMPDQAMVWLLNLDMIEQQTGRLLDRLMVPREQIGSSTIGFDADRVLYSKLRPNLNKVLLPDRPGVATSEILPLRVIAKTMSKEYLCWFLRSPAFVTYAQSRTAGAKMPRLGSKALLDARIPVPPLSRQREIVAQLEGLQKIFQLSNSELSRLRQLAKSRFVEMFGDAIWPKTTIGELSEFLTSGSRGWAKYYSDEGELFITIKNVKNTRISFDDVQHIVPPQGAEADRTRVREGDLLISITADLGRTGVVTDEIASRGAYINQHLTRISLKRNVVDPLYAAFYIESPGGKEQIERHNQSAVKAGLNFESIRSIQLPLPPIGKQRQFSAFIEQLDKSEFAIRKRLEKARLLYRAKLQGV